MSSPKIVKRYANRKLYDTERSCYVTLEDIAVMIKAGDEVQVVDNKTGEDLTSVTLAQIIFESEKKRNVMPLALLRGLIQERTEILGEFAREQVDTVKAKAADIKERAEKLKTDLEVRVDRVISRKADGSPGEPPATEAERARILTDLVGATQHAIDDLQRGVEDKVKGSVGAVSRYAHLGREMDELRQRLVDLEKRLGKIPQA